MNEWQPIETVPRDETKVDLWDGNRRYADCVWDEKEKKWAIAFPLSQDDFLFKYHLRPTHWMFCPKPPNVN